MPHPFPTEPYKIITVNGVTAPAQHFHVKVKNHRNYKRMVRKQRARAPNSLRYYIREIEAIAAVVESAEPLGAVKVSSSPQRHHGSATGHLRHGQVDYQHGVPIKDEAIHSASGSDENTIAEDNVSEAATERDPREGRQRLRYYDQDSASSALSFEDPIQDTNDFGYARGSLFQLSPARCKSHSSFGSTTMRLQVHDSLKERDTNADCKDIADKETNEVEDDVSDTSSLDYAHQKPHTCTKRIPLQDLTPPTSTPSRTTEANLRSLKLGRWKPPQVLRSVESPVPHDDTPSSPAPSTVDVDIEDIPRHIGLRFSDAGPSLGLRWRMDLSKTMEEGRLSGLVRRMLKCQRQCGDV
ncbi:MAG: hypothetical protein Q9164_002988 [Protoblastenia rupestris]